MFKFSDSVSITSFWCSSDFRVYMYGTGLCSLYIYQQCTTLLMKTRIQINSICNLEWLGKNMQQSVFLCCAEISCGYGCMSMGVF
uniref:Uncharacterized protein n=1 Tax=Rhizophora mucronata TaxID=61149 RepID=A0A2P2N4Y9_RHIMU